jgi:RWP-RK domain
VLRTHRALNVSRTMQEAYQGLGHDDDAGMGSGATAYNVNALPPNYVRREPGHRMPRPSTLTNDHPCADDLAECDTLEKLQSVFHLPINDAAKALDMGVTVLKKLCRDRGIKRWPYRKLSSVDKLIQSVEAVRLRHITCNSSMTLWLADTRLGSALQSN